MATAPTTPLVSVDEYLNSSYRPDVEYVDGYLVKRSVPTYLHSILQAILVSYFRQFEKQYKFKALPELRTQIGGAELLAGFYAIFAENMRDLGSPVHSRNLFAHAIEALAESIRIFMVYKDEIPVAGAFYLWHGKLAEVPWASSRREFRALCPNNLLYWSVLKHACEQGMRAFDFGRSTRDSGTFKFKEQWGAKPEPLYWNYLLAADAQAPDATHSSTKARMMVEAWKRLPLWLANALGPRVRGRISA